MKSPVFWAYLMFFTSLIGCFFIPDEHRWWAVAHLVLSALLVVCAGLAHAHEGKA